MRCALFVSSQLLSVVSFLFSTLLSLANGIAGGLREKMHANFAASGDLLFMHRRARHQDRFSVSLSLSPSRLPQSSLL